MTVGAWIFIGILALFGLGLGVALLVCGIGDKSTAPVIGGILTIVITIAICVAFIWYRSNSESGKRALKDQQSNLTGGIERTVRVYDINGELIEEYSGKFDIETDRDNYILFDDENGNRHIIYFTTGTIIVDEE